MTALSTPASTPTHFARRTHGATYLCANLTAPTMHALRALTPHTPAGSPLQLTSPAECVPMSPAIMRVLTHRRAELQILADLDAYIQVVNLKSRRPKEEGLPVHPVDRTTVLGNPFPVIGTSHWNSRTDHALRLADLTDHPTVMTARSWGGFERATTLGLYLTWLRAAYTSTPEVRRMMLLLYAQVMTGEMIGLGCHCSPQACHAAVLRQALLKLIRAQYHG